MEIGSSEGDMEDCEDEVVEDAFDDIATFIVPGIYLGSIDAARNSRGLESTGITHFLRCCCDDDVREVNYDPRDDPPDAHVLPWSDDPAVDLLKNGRLEEALDHLWAILLPVAAAPLSRPRAILVHCIAGRSRSVTVVIAWLIVNKGMTLAKALHLVLSVRPWIDPNQGFLNQLEVLSGTFFSTIDRLHSPTADMSASILRWLPRLDFAPQFVDIIRNGDKRATTRLLGEKDTDLSSDKDALAVGMPCRAVAAGKEFAVLRVERFSDRTFADIDDELACIENLSTGLELQTILHHFYPGASNHDQIRVIYFSVFTS